MLVFTGYCIDPGSGSSCDRFFLLIGPSGVGVKVWND